MITHGAFWSTAMHELIGQLTEYASTPYGLPTRIYPGAEMADVESFMLVLCILSFTGYKHPPLIGDWTHLFLDDDKNVLCCKAHEQFMADLRQLCNDIRRANTGGMF